MCKSRILYNTLPGVLRSVRISNSRIINRYIAGIVTANSIIHQSYSTNLPKSSTFKVFNSKYQPRLLCTVSNPSHQGKLRMEKIDSIQFKSIFDKELYILINVFKKHNYELRIAGGAVRDLLSGIQPEDLDFATSATPSEMLAMFELEGIRTLNCRGEKHGTVTCRINNKVNYEVTTLRIDVVTDGRHAEVRFTTDWQLDALRRDLTINSMFLDFDGIIYDYFNGMNDLKSKKVKFVGDAANRIQEDYLRILRYFRFYGRISHESDTIDEETLKAIKENMNGLKGISGERIWLEMKKILTGRLGDKIIENMINMDLVQYLGFPQSPDYEVYHEMYKLCAPLSPLPITLATGLLNTPDDMATLHARVKISNVELNTGLFIIANRDHVSDVKDMLQWSKDQLLSDAGKDPKLKDKVIEFLKYIGKDKQTIEDFIAYDAPKFPVNGNDLLKAGVPKGRMIAQVSDELRTRWSKENCSLSCEHLVQLIPGIVKEFQEKSASLLKSK